MSYTGLPAGTGYDDFVFRTPYVFPEEEFPTMEGVSPVPPVSVAITPTTTFAMPEFDFLNTLAPRPTATLSITGLPLYSIKSTPTAVMTVTVPTIAPLRSYPDTVFALNNRQWVLGPLASQPGFRVVAVTAGVYNGELMNPGDVFDLVYANDFSDAAVDYSRDPRETQYGWMKKAPAGIDAVFEENVNAPLFPVSDPNRRTVY